LKVNSASCWFLLHGYITMRGQQKVRNTQPTVESRWVCGNKKSNKCDSNSV